MYRWRYFICIVQFISATWKKTNSKWNCRYREVEMLNNWRRKSSQNTIQKSTGNNASDYSHSSSLSTGIETKKSQIEEEKQFLSSTARIDFILFVNTLNGIKFIKIKSHHHHSLTHCVSDIVTDRLSETIMKLHCGRLFEILTNWRRLWCRKTFFEKIFSCARAVITFNIKIAILSKKK